MSEQYKMAMDAALAGGRSKDEAEAYLSAVEAFGDTFIGLKGAGIAPTSVAMRSAMRLINLLTDSLFRRARAAVGRGVLVMLKRCYDAASGCLYRSALTSNP